jgi:hypothetical protein
MTTATDHLAATESTRPADAPFAAVRRRLLGTDGSITHVGNIGYTFGGGGMGLLARRFGMAAGGPLRHHAHAWRLPADVSRPGRHMPVGVESVDQNSVSFAAP